MKNPRLSLGFESYETVLKHFKDKYPELSIQMPYYVYCHAIASLAESNKVETIWLDKEQTELKFILKNDLIEFFEKEIPEILNAKKS